MNTAQMLNAAWIGLDVDYYNRETARVATQQTQMMREGYKAPHAMRGTIPKKPKRVSTSLTKRLFKGHRP
jgi:hypothetical protein